ncbi:unannotated protein [freshwater metagenome]|jgi:sec-independent protein translocase protein TatA|uniref:Unannotated protein n=1 Tax=freshwater metagenome TaxID=449393 RepID=A0A6J7E0G3_9ZZZZ|nr:Sec-independent protein translocase subunit TatA [Actinomycetota bacterium]
MLGNLKPGELIVLLIIILLLFGGKRLPGAARGLGQSLRIFKSEVTKKDDEEEDSDSPQPPVH